MSWVIWGDLGHSRLAVFKFVHFFNKLLLYQLERLIVSVLRYSFCTLSSGSRAAALDKEYVSTYFLASSRRSVGHIRILDIGLELAWNGGSCGGISLKRD